MSADSYLSLSVVLPVTSIGVFLTAVDGSIVNVTLPVINDALSTNLNVVSWVVVAYLLTLSSFMGLGGTLGDNYGRKKIFQLGMLIFGIGSALCSLSPTVYILIAARVIQAIGAVGIQANGLALVISLIDPAKRGRAIGVNSVVVAAALSIGPPLGGFLAEFLGWESIFWINIPISVIGIVAVQIVLPETINDKQVNLDWIGVILFALAAFMAIAGMKLSLEGQPLLVILLILAPLVGYIFTKHERKHPNPIISIRIMKNKQIMFGSLAAIFSYSAVNVFTILLPFYFTDILNISPSNIGLYLIVIPIALVLMGPVAGYLSDKYNTRLLSSLGAILQAITIICLAIIMVISDDGIPLGLLLFLVGLSAAFLSFFTNPNGTRVMDASNHEELSVVSGILNLSRNVGFTLGSSLSPALFLIFRNYFSNFHSSPDVAYVNGLGLTFMVFGIFAFIGFLFSFFRGEEGLIHTRN